MKKIKVKVSEVNYDSEGEDLSLLPQKFEFEFDETERDSVEDGDAVAEKISELTGWCVDSVKFKILGK